MVKLFGCVCVAALSLAGAVPALAHTSHRHHTTHSSHKTSHASSYHGSHKTSSHAMKGKPAPHDKAVAGAISVPAGGTKLYCSAGRNPLLVRKATQGSGTTVTVLCR